MCATFADYFNILAAGMGSSFFFRISFGTFTKHQGLLSWLLLPLDFSLCGKAKSRVVLLIGIYSIIQFSSIFVFFYITKKLVVSFRHLLYLRARYLSVMGSQPITKTAKHPSRSHTSR